MIQVDNNQSKLGHLEPFFSNITSLLGKGQNQKSGSILEFKDFHDKFCWEVLFIAGGGLVMATGAQVDFCIVWE